VRKRLHLGLSERSVMNNLVVPRFVGLPAYFAFIKIKFKQDN
jgi:hypothetical protein